MADDVAVPFVGVNRSRLSSRNVPSFMDVSKDVIHEDFFCFFNGPYHATYPEGGVAGNYEFTREQWDAPYQPTFGVLTKEVFRDLAICKTMSMLHSMMMSHGGELLARYRGLNQYHHEYVLSMESRLKGYDEKVASLTGLELQVSTLKKQVSGLNNKLSSFNVSFAKLTANVKKRKKKIKSLNKSLDNLHAKVARLSAGLNRATVLEVEKGKEILYLKATPLITGFERGLSMHRTKDEFAVVLKKMDNFRSGAQDRLAEASPKTH
nr:hypothetical protein [Tanacetum cinerariifolium]